MRRDVGDVVKKLVLTVVLAVASAAGADTDVADNVAPIAPIDVPIEVRPAADDVRAVDAAVAPAIFRLAMLDGNDDDDEEVGHGTGFVVADGVLATNHHVIDKVPGAMLAIGRDGVKHRVVGVLADDPLHDLALIRIDATGLEPLPLGDATQLHRGDPVLLVGSSSGYDQSLGVGVIAALRDDFPEHERKRMKRRGQVITGPLVQHTATASAGSSGSPVVDMQGHVIAIEHSGINGTGLSFAARVDLLQALLGRTDLTATPTPIGPNVRRNLLISAAVIGVPAIVVVVVNAVQRRRRRRQRRAIA